MRIYVLCVMHVDEKLCMKSILHGCGRDRVIIVLLRSCFGVS